MIPIRIRPIQATIFFFFFFFFLSCSKVSKSFHQSSNRAGFPIDPRQDTLVETFRHHKSGKIDFQVYKLSNKRLFVQDIDYYKNGEYVVYHKAGHLKKEQGPTYWYYPDGKLRAVTTMVDGKAEGLSRYYHQNGALEGTCYYKKGEYEGTMRLFWENGQSYGEQDYENGRLKAVRGFFNKQGKPLPIGTFNNGNGELWSYDDAGEKVEEIEIYRNGRVTRTIKNLK